MMERQIDFLEAKTRELDILAEEIVAATRKLLARYFYREFVPSDSLTFRKEDCQRYIDPSEFCDGESDCLCEKEEKEAIEKELQEIKAQQYEVILKYEHWYTISLAFIQAYTPERVNEFTNYYEREVDSYEKMGVMNHLKLEFAKSVNPRYQAHLTRNQKEQEISGHGMYGFELDCDSEGNEISRGYIELICDTFVDIFRKQRSILKYLLIIVKLKEQERERKQSRANLNIAQEDSEEVAKLRRELQIAKKSLPSLVADDELRQRCEDLLVAEGHYDRVILQACIVLESRVRNAIGSNQQTTGIPLMEKAFSPKNPALRFSELEQEQLGIMQLYRGTIAFFRNTTGHHLINTYTRDDALRFVAWVDLLLNMLKIV